MEVVDLSIQHLEEALQLALQVALPELTLLDVCLQGPHLVFQVLIVSFCGLTRQKGEGSRRQGLTENSCALPARRPLRSERRLSWGPIPFLVVFLRND